MEPISHRTDSEIKIKLVVIYQVIMHYRLPLYKRLSEDPDFDFTLLFGKDKPGTKLINAKISGFDIKNSQLSTIRIPFKTNNSASTMPLSPFLFFRLAKLSPDVVFSEGASSLLNSSIAFLYAKIFKKKFIWWSLGKLKDREFNGIRKLLNNWQIYIEKRSDAIFTYSSLGKEYFTSLGIPSQRVFVGVNVLDTNQKLKEVKEYPIMPIMNNFAGCFNIAFIGSITKEKNLELLISTLALFNKRNGNIGRLHIIGDGSHLQELINYADSNLLGEFVVFHGRINSGPSAILQSCDLMVLPGLGGLAICEAMINKLPVITGNADGTEYDLIDNSCGFIMPEMNLENLGDKLELLYKDPLTRKQMGAAAFKRITEEFSFNSYYHQFKNVIDYAFNK